MVHTLVEILAALIVLYGVIIAALWLYARRHPDVVSMRHALRMLPDVLRLIRRLAADKTLPRGLRIRLFLLIAYLASPIDIVPDFIPILGYADDVVVIALALRSVAHTAGPQALARHWPGSPEGLAMVKRLAGLNSERPADPN